MSKLTIRYMDDCKQFGSTKHIYTDRMIITDEFGVVWFDDGGDDVITSEGDGGCLADKSPYELAYKILQGLGYEVEIL